MDSDKRQQNLDALAPLSNPDANGRFIQKQSRWRFEIMRLLAVFLRRQRKDKVRAETNAELFMDDWLFHHGKTEKTLTDADRINLMNDTITRVTEQHDTRSRRMLAEDERSSDGPLGDFADFNAPMGDSPSDGDIADSICKTNPELKQYRKNLR